MQKESSAALAYLPAPRRDVAASPERRQPRASKRMSMQQAFNMMEAVAFARTIGLPLVAHLTIHWAFTDVGDDSDGKLFAKVREGLDKWAQRHGFPLTGIWARERIARGQGEAVHCHLLFHLPVDYRSGKGLRAVEAAIYRLINRHGRHNGQEQGDGYWADNVAKLVIYHNPDGKYLIKGGGPDVWEGFRVRKEDRSSQGLIHGKRCGTTENIGPSARSRRKSAQDKKEQVRELRSRPPAA
jgi:hypothetical protein